MTAIWLAGAKPDRSSGERAPILRCRRRSLLWMQACAQAGTAAIEFALAAPLLLGLLTLIVDLGFAYSQQMQVQQAVQAGAQYATLHPWNSTSISAIATTVASATQLSALTASPAPMHICGCPDGSQVTAATCDSPCADGESAGYYVIVSARLAYSPIVPYSLLGNSVILSAQATVREK